MPPTHFSDGPHQVPSISDHALIGNLKTAALISINGSIESMCMPYFDSPSIFARIVDSEKGGHFQISPTMPHRTKQAYLPTSNVLTTKFLSEEGVGLLTDTLVPKGAAKPGKVFLPWMVRRVEVITGKVTFRVECAPAFDYARQGHELKFVDDDTQARAGGREPTPRVVFNTPALSVDLRTLVSGEVEEQTGDADPAGETRPQEQEGAPEAGAVVEWRELDLRPQGHQGVGVWAEFELSQGEVVDFVFRQIPCEQEKREEADKGENRAIHVRPEKAHELGVGVDTLANGVSKLRPDSDPVCTPTLVTSLIEQTDAYWKKWVGGCSYTGRWREVVQRQALFLKMTIFEETGAIIAAPSFGLPEEIYGERNYDYRFTWIRDSSFTLYALIRLGFTDEANAYMDFIHSVVDQQNSDGSLQIMYTIHGGREAPEEELTHLAGHKHSKPVRIGNAAVDHLQLDIYGELMDAVVNLAQKYSSPLSWEKWVACRRTVDWVVANYDQPDLSIWEVRSQKQNYLYSKVMVWVAIDRGLRLADKRSLPLGAKQRAEWLAARDSIYEEIMDRGWNKDLNFFPQSYEGRDVADSAVLIMPLCFFISAADPRFRSTLERILSPPEKGGLMQNNLILRYDTRKVDDGLSGNEGAFSLCTLWTIEALARAGVYDSELLKKAEAMLTDFLGYGNHVGLFSEEISISGEGLGNTPQGFSAVTLISTIYNLSRALDRHF